MLLTHFFKLIDLFWSPVLQNSFSILPLCLMPLIFFFLEKFGHLSFTFHVLHLADRFLWHLLMWFVVFLGGGLF